MVSLHFQAKWGRFSPPLRSATSLPSGSSLSLESRVSWASVFTWVFSVDLTHVSLAEHDAQLELVLEGQESKYMGRLNQKEHLSNYERWTGRHGKFDEKWAYDLVTQALNLRRHSIREESGYKTEGSACKAGEGSFKSDGSVEVSVSSN